MIFEKPPGAAAARRTAPFCKTTCNADRELQMTFAKDLTIGAVETDPDASTGMFALSGAPVIAPLIVQANPTLPVTGKSCDTRGTADPIRTSNSANVNSD